jgi:hypothetical protein
VAELCKRPLYPITCGDLGITAVEVETRLKRIFIQAQKWKCVLLLDEVGACREVLMWQFLSNSRNRRRMFS